MAAPSKRAALDFALGSDDPERMEATIADVNPATPCVGQAVRNGAAQCTAHSKRSGLRCGAAAMKGRETCYHHGGTSLRGMSSPKLTHGRRSKYLPPLTRASYEESLASDAHKDLSDELALIDARITELSGQLQSGERGTVWDDLQLAVQDIQAGQPLPEALETLKSIAAKGKSTVAAWRELGEQMDRKARLAQADARRAADQAEVITRPQLALMIHAIVYSIRQHVTDQHTRAAIASDLDRVIHVQPERKAEKA